MVELENWRSETGRGPTVEGGEVIISIRAYLEKAGPNSSNACKVGAWEAFEQNHYAYAIYCNAYSSIRRPFCSNHVRALVKSPLLSSIAFLHHSIP